ncbi:MAG: hypothetical protein P8L77_05045 [Gammaproteobacteria bacterium]|nr:hypothetical protein [Gammaproteobacteria bacterium]
MIDEFVPITLLNFIRRKWLHVMAPLGFSLASFFLTFLINYLLTQMLIPEAYGEATLTLAWLTILGSIVTLGADQTVLRFLTRLIDDKNLTEISDFLSWGAQLITKPVVVCLSLALIIFSILSAGLISDQNSPWLSFFGILLIATPILGITNCLTSVLLAYRKTGHATFIQYLAFQLCLVVILIICLGYDIKNIRVTFIYEIFLGSLFILLILSIWFCNKLPMSFMKHICTKHYTSNTNTNRSIWRQCAYRQATSMLIYNLIINLDFLLMGFYGKDTPTLGFYNLAIAISDIIWLVPQSLFQYLRSEIEVSLKSETKIVSLQKHWDKTLALNAILVLSLFCIIFTESKYILKIFDEAYLQTTPFLNILLIGNTLTALLGCPSIALRYSGNVNKLVFINLTAVILMIVLSMLFVTLFGLIGIGYACAITWVLQCLAENLIAKKYTQLKPLKWI